MTPCPPADGLERLLDCRLDEPEAVPLRQHLAECPTCQACLDELSEPAGLRAWRGGATPAPLPTDPRLGRLLAALRATPQGTAVGGDAEPASGALPPLGPPAQTGDLGTLGPYRILAEVGRGGMGVVLQAFDPALARTVALKVLLPDRADAAARRRFVREARAAAAVRHDHVVPVHAVSDIDAAVPYLVMEFVEGPSLRERLRAEGRLEPREAARLVLHAADGLAAAHALGLIHRDVKPANIIHDRVRDRARVVDFGLVRALNQTGGTTRDGTAIGTPEYMSPEHVRDPDRLDARADVYCLGVTLYELLTGDVPFRGTPHMVVQRILTDDPLPPRRLNDAMPRDLETICLKAMAKEQGCRYSSAADLRDDLRRFLAGEPVRARPAGRAERWWRWCRRKPVVAALAAALVLVFLAGFLGVFGQWRRAEAKSRDAEASAAESDRNFRLARAAVDKFFKRVFEEGMLDKPGMEGQRKQVLEEVLHYYQEFVAQRRDDPSLRSELAETHFRIGLLTSQYGSKTEALTSFENGVALYQALADDHPDDPQFTRGLVRCHSYAGMMLMGLDRAAEGVVHAEQARDLMVRSVRAAPGDKQMRKRLANVCGNLGNLYGQASRPADALRTLHEVRAIHEELVRDDPLVGENAIDLAKTLNNIGLVTADPAESLSWHEQARALREQIVRDFPESGPNIPFDLAGSHYQIGLNQAQLGQREESIRSFRRAIDLLVPIVRGEPVVHYQLRLEQCYMALSGQQRELRQWSDAIISAEQALTIAQTLARISPAEFQGEVKKIDDWLDAVRRDLVAGVGPPAKQ